MIYFTIDGAAPSRANEVFTMPKRVTVTQESETGRNERFRDNYTGQNMTRNQFVREINNGNYDNYHVRIINNVPTPVSNPDNSERNNLD